ncbi:O-methyltransferase [Nigerium massiliense]|uniref:O-methyltransferase n=1 Tax=Nigerium massiliense TaxID=1522317 RepID=UPI00058D2408|nr:class I SAM-dependent methyltransferase [Nigerium massiliense]
MEATTLKFLDELLRSGRAHDEDEPDHDRQYRNVERAGAELLHLLVSGRPPGPILEIGTSNGYSGIWLADAAGEGGEVVSVDDDKGRSAEAAKNLAEVGLADRVRLVVADAGAFLRDQPDGAWDLIFLDADRSAYAAYWPDLRRVLAGDGLIAVDNCTSHAEQVAEFRAVVDADRDVESVLTPVGAGVLLIAHRR